MYLVNVTVRASFIQAQVLTLVTNYQVSGNTCLCDMSPDETRGLPLEFDEGVFM